MSCETPRNTRYSTDTDSQDTARQARTSHAYRSLEVSPLGTMASLTLDDDDMLPIVPRAANVVNTRQGALFHDCSDALPLVPPSTSSRKRSTCDASAKAPRSEPNLAAEAPPQASQDQDHGPGPARARAKGKSSKAKMVAKAKTKARVRVASKATPKPNAKKKASPKAKTSIAAKAKAKRKQKQKRQQQTPKAKARSKQKAKPVKLRTRKPMKEKKQKLQPMQALFLAEVEDKPLAKAFQWPQHLTQQLLQHHPPDKPLHVQLYSEFSGAGTAEFAAQALEAACDPLCVDVVSVADWNTNAATALVANTGPETHVFGDIAEVCSEKMRRLCDRPMCVKVGPSM